MRLIILVSAFFELEHLFIPNQPERDSSMLERKCSKYDLIIHSSCSLPQSPCPWYLLIFAGTLKTCIFKLWLWLTRNPVHGHWWKCSDLVQHLTCHCACPVLAVQPLTLFGCSIQLLPQHFGLPYYCSWAEYKDIEILKAIFIMVSIALKGNEAANKDLPYII